MPLTVALHKHHLIAIRIADYDDADVLPRMTDLAFSAGFLELIDLVIEVGLDSYLFHVLWAFGDQWTHQLPFALCPHVSRVLLETSSPLH
jgi:hypothetical protein